jgi:CRP-like cAMP-binding protein
MIPIKTESAWRGTSDCRSCGIRDMVLFADLNEQDFGMIHAPIDDLEFAAGEALYTEGSRAQGIYTLRRGMIKLVRVTADGRQRIVRVLRPGDWRAEALGGGILSDAVALTEVPVHPLSDPYPGAKAPPAPAADAEWQRRSDADDWLADLNFGTARQRVSNFILKMRSPTDGHTVTLFARDDMGAMLDLKLETVSREVSRLVREAVIEPLDKQGRVYRLHEPQRLLQVA